MKQLLTLLLIVSTLTPLSGLATASLQDEPYTEQKTNILVAANKPEFTLKLKANPTTGYSWFIRECDAHYLEPSSHHFEAPDNKKMAGAPGYEFFTFKVKPAAFMVPHQTPLRLVYARPWEKSEQSTSITFWVSTSQTAEH